MKQQAYKAATLADLPETAQHILANNADASVLLFTGEMGAGKTTFIKALVKQMGSMDEVTSPTFSLVNEYLDAEGNSIFHFDLYRMNDPDELLDIGFEEYLRKGICLIEWPQMAEIYMPDDALVVRIKVEDGERIFRVGG